MSKTGYHNLRLFDGLQDQLQERKIVLVAGDRITAVEDEAARDQYLDHEFVDLKAGPCSPG